MLRFLLMSCDTEQDKVSANHIILTQETNIHHTGYISKKNKVKREGMKKKKKKKSDDLGPKQETKKW